MDVIYPVEILYVVNPHVIFVEAKDSDKELIIEQVGIYGIIPINHTIDIDGKLVAERCENWPAAATSMLSEILADHRSQVHFEPIQEENRSTIFNNNSIKFGYVYIKIDRNMVGLHDRLVKHSVAEYNEVIFHHRLATGSLKLKLNEVRSEEVLKAIKKYYSEQNRDVRVWQKAIDKQTTLYQEGRDIAHKLTAENIELLQRNAEPKGDLMAIINRKTADLSLCKDADQQSLGRGVKRHKQRSKEDKKDHNDNENRPNSVLSEVRKFLATKNKAQSNLSKNSSTRELNNNLSPPSPTLLSNGSGSHLQNSHTTCNENNGNEIRNAKSNNDNIMVSRDCFASNDDFDSPDALKPMDINKSTRVKQPPMKKSPKKAPGRLVAYGPCTSDINNLKIQRVTDDFSSTDTEVKVQDQELGDTFQENIQESIHITQEEKKLKETLSKIELSQPIYVSKMLPEKRVQSDSSCVNVKKNNQSPLPTSGYLRTLLQKKAIIDKLDSENSVSSHSDTSVKDSSSSCKEPINDEEDIESIVDKLKSEYKPLVIKPKLTIKPIQNIANVERHVNPFKNLHSNKSVFVDKLVGPILMVHSKNNNLVLPQSNIRDVPFKTDIHIGLKNMNITEPSRLQTVSWPYILRGHSVFIIGPARSGKTVGYLPAVCNLVVDASDTNTGMGPICVIVCATAASVTMIEKNCKRFLASDKVVLACFAGTDMTEFVPSLLNGCHVLVSTAAMLYKLLGTDLGVDLRRLFTIVFEDCERLAEVYATEIRVIQHHVKDMLKNRADSSAKVQCVVASRTWCDFMTPLAKNSPDTIITISAFQECVPYSKTKTSVQFVLKENKTNAVVEFLNEVDGTKRKVIVCRSDDEVKDLETVLKQLKYTVFACNNDMSITDLYNINVAWYKYEVPVFGPILICCDGNLTHLNVTNAFYLVHYSMPEMFSMFCKRFSVLNENYSSIFQPANQNVKIKILLEESNSEQLPKILHFVERCTNEKFPMLNEITREVLDQKDMTKAEHLVPICNSLMTLGECADLWNCRERHAILKDFDQSKPWMPEKGMITFKVMFYNSAVTYSARILSNVTKSGITKFPNNFAMLSMKMGLYYSKECNKKLQGIVKLGDVCAFALMPNLFVRCQVIKILSYSKGNPHFVRINLIDEERLEDTKDVHLYYLPDELKNIETHVVKVRLANVQPQDKDVTFSALARKEMKQITEEDESLYLRGQVIMTIGNCIFVDSLEACLDLTNVEETVVKYDIKKELLSRHAEPNPQHILKLHKLGGELVEIENKIEVPVPTRYVKRPVWAHLDKNDFSAVIFSGAIDAGCFFVRLDKFQKVINTLVKDIEHFALSSPELPVEEIYVENIVLAQFPDDQTYERARIDAVIDEKKVKCFFVDNGDWREISVKCLRPIPDNILHRVPFQAIECRLVGVQPPSSEWTEFGTNWFCDNCFEDGDRNTKYLFAKYCTKETATITGGHKYGIILVDTSTERDVIINKQMIELNLARENETESEFLDQPLNMTCVNVTNSSSDGDEMWESDNNVIDEGTCKDLIPVGLDQNSQIETDIARQILFDKPIRSIPLVDDSDCNDSDCSLNIDSEMAKMVKFLPIPALTDIENNANNIESEKSLKMHDDNDIQQVLNDKADKNDLDSDDLSSESSGLQRNESIRSVEDQSSKIIEVADAPRKPRLIWRQNQTSVSVKIQLIGVENYSLDIKEKSIKFNAFHNDTNYAFDFELYGVVDVKKSRHSSKGQYILVVLTKFLKKNWLNLAKDCTIKNWISYDVDAIDSYSDDEPVANDDMLEVIKKNFETVDTDSEDDDFADDANFSYKKHFND